ncbi:hypothetical protein HanXRQr2_Chr08g0323621 [Helianthus annuus]|uniref:Uncharacterized protein n=1 Tax=Helianthus annuus TaxID=4232 RepID=A0A9K3IC88_HELAN|nr:hypothetical protein HanXRQr2_Chr08g0323621 [Helianthus annuus]
MNCWLQIAPMISLVPLITSFTQYGLWNWKNPKGERTNWVYMNIGLLIRSSKKAGIMQIARKGLDAAAHDQQSMKGLVCKLYMFTIFILQLITSLDIWIVIYLATGKFEIGLLWSQLFSIRSHRAM